MSVNSKMTALADEVRELSGTTAAKSIDMMVSDVDAANAEIVRQAELLAQIIAVLESKTNPSVAEERLEGDGQEFYTTAPSTLSFRSTAPLNELQDIQINGETVDPDNYTLEEGSTIVKLKHDYLSTLDVGQYELSVVSNSKTAKGGFTVAAPELNEHGFYYNQPYTAYVDYFGATTSFFIREDGTLDAFVNNLTEVCTYMVNGKDMVITSTSMGELHLTFSDDGAEVYNTELSTTFVLGDESIVADEDYIYRYNEELGGYAVTAIDKTKASYSPIKSGINGYSTVKLEDMMFVYSVGGSATFNTALTVAPQIPDSVIVIGEYAFGGCSNLESITIPESVTTIGDYAFTECRSLTNVTLPSGVIQIGKEAFQCAGLTSIVVPENVTIIREYMFAHCPLNSVTIDNKVTAIDAHAFGSCTSLESITFTGTVAQWNAMTLSPHWNFNVLATHVHCIDGDVAL